MALGLASSCLLASTPAPRSQVQLKHFNNSNYAKSVFDDGDFSDFNLCEEAKDEAKYGAKDEAKGEAKNEAREEARDEAKAEAEAEAEAVAVAVAEAPKFFKVSQISF